MSLPLLPFAKNIDKVFKEKLVGRGFRKHRYVFTMDITEETSVFLGLGRSLYRAEQVVLYLPTIGVINKEVNRLHIEWDGYAQEIDQSPSTCEPLYYLMPQNQDVTWRFFPDVDIMENTSDLVENVFKYGVPWVEGLSQRETLLEHLITKRGQVDEGLRYSIPALYVLLGRKAEAIAIVKEKAEEIKGHWRENIRADGQEYEEKMLRILS